MAWRFIEDKVGVRLAARFAELAVAAAPAAQNRDGRRNRYQIQAHLPLPEPASRERTVGEVLALLAGTNPTG